MKKIFAANWKLQKSPSEARFFAETFLNNVGSDFFNTREVFIFPQNFSLEALLTSVQNSKIQVGPQNIYFEKAGAFTGENSVEVSHKMGAGLVLLGHSERRQYFFETHDTLEKKINLSQELGVLPVFCIGESLEQRQNNQTEEVCYEQIELSLKSADKNKRIILAYEPVWAIGTGQVATLDQVSDIHAKLNSKMTILGFNNFQILYGGSVKAENANALIQIKHVDGFLIGGASLDPSSFLKICQSI